MCPDFECVQVAVMGSRRGLYLQEFSEGMGCSSGLEDVFVSKGECEENVGLPGDDGVALEQSIADGDNRAFFNGCGNLAKGTDVGVFGEGDFCESFVVTIYGATGVLVELTVVGEPSLNKCGWDCEREVLDETLIEKGDGYMVGPSCTAGDEANFNARIQALLVDEAFGYITHFGKCTGDGGEFGGVVLATGSSNDGQGFHS